MMRLRLVSVQVTPVFVVEDGNGDLAPGPIANMIEVSAAHLDNISPFIRNSVTRLQDELNRTGDQLDGSANAAP